MASEGQSGSGSGQSWWNRLTSNLQSRRALVDDEDTDTEPLLPARTNSKSRVKRLWPGWEQVLAYLVILILVFGAGWYTSKAFTRRATDKKDDGPMVAPVWTLPPVSSSSPSVQPFESKHTDSFICSLAVYLGILLI